MSAETTLAVQPEETDASLAIWGSREKVREIAARLKKFVPGTKNMNDAEIMAYAQLVHMTGLNPCSGEIYGWDSRGDGSGELITKVYYGIMVRWAQSQEPFSTRFTTTIDPETEDIASVCHLLRQSDRPLLKDLLANNVDYHEALDWATTQGIGVISKSERWSTRYKKWIDPPKGRTWAWKAEKRALEDAITRAYGEPSTKELAQQTWIVQDTLTIPTDWEDVTPEMLPAEREAMALYSARRRLSPPTEPKTFAESMGELGFPLDVDEAAGEIVEQPQAPPEPEPAEETGQATRTVVEPPKKPTKNGLDKLFTEVNVRLAANTLEPYANKEDMVAVLKVIGYGSYNKESHATMVSQLIAEKEPNGKSHPASGGDT